MAVDPKTGKPAEEASFYDLFGVPAPVPPPPDMEPRGVSVLRGAYGPWLAAQELLREGRP